MKPRKPKPNAAKVKKPSKRKVAARTGLTDYPVSQFGNPPPFVIPAEAPFGNGCENRTYGTDRNYAPPPTHPEETFAIFQRIERDISELVARAFHQSVDRWTTETVTRHHDARQAMKHFFGCEFKEEPMEGEAALNERRELDAKQAGQAAHSLALVGQSAARWLEHLSKERLELLRAVAGKFGTWPVNLGMGKAKRTGQRDIQRVAVVENYLRRLDLNSVPYWPKTENPAADGVSPFRLAAEQLYGALRGIKSDPRRYFTTPPPPRNAIEVVMFRNRPIKFLISRWGKRLLALDEPMTKANASAWWSVAKMFLDELWVNQPEKFRPLIAHLRLGDPSYTPSLVRSRVIDDGLKKAFKALAV